MIRSTAPAIPLDGSLLESILRVARENAELTAIERGNRRVTFTELHRMADDLGRKVRQSGMQPGHPLVVWMEDPMNVTVAILASVKFGYVFVPLDVRTPERRREKILQLVKPPVTVTDLAHTDNARPDGCIV